MFRNIKRKFLLSTLLVILVGGIGNVEGQNVIPKDSLIYLKTSYRQPPTFYIKDKNGETKLRVRDISIDEQYAYRNGTIVYAAYAADPRWGWLDYSEIRVLDIRSGQQRRFGADSQTDR